MGTFSVKIEIGGVDGESLEEVEAQVDTGATTTWVIFGEEGSSALLGAYTLEGVFLGVDPYGQKLIPVHGLLKVAARP